MADRQAVRDQVFSAIGDATAKPLRGYRGAGVLEVLDDYDGDTYRTVYTVRFSDAVYVLHAFQKKSKHEAATSKHDVEIVNAWHELVRQAHARRTAAGHGEAT